MTTVLRNRCFLHQVSCCLPTPTLHRSELCALMRVFSVFLCLASLRCSLSTNHCSCPNSDSQRHSVLLIIDGHALHLHSNVAIALPFRPRLPKPPLRPSLSKLPLPTQRCCPASSPSQRSMAPPARRTSTSPTIAVVTVSPPRLSSPTASSAQLASLLLSFSTANDCHYCCQS